MKYIIYIDYKADYTANGGKDSEFIKSEAKTLLDAIAEADALYNGNVYLIRIMEAITKPSKVEDYSAQTYHAVLAKRSAGWHSAGWHRNTEEYNEGVHLAMRTWSKGWESIETI